MPTEKSRIHVLLVEDNRGDAELIQELLADVREVSFEVECAERLSAALARIQRGGLDAILLDLLLPDSAGLATFLEIHRQAAQVPIVVLTGMEDEALALSAVRAGAQDYLVKGRTPPDALARCLRYGIERQRSAARVQPEPAKKRGKVLAFIGAKGGVGTTTVALNVASALTRRSSVILAELRPGCGTAAQQLRLPAHAENLTVLLGLPPEAPLESEIEKRLWKTPSGLRVLLGPQAPSEFREIPPRLAGAIVETLAGLAEVVVLDLPSSSAEANRAALRRSDRVSLVVEREPGSVDAARWVLELLRESNVAQSATGAVVVNRVALGCPPGLNEIASRLGIPVAAVIPPDADLCAAAYTAGSPAVFFQPESAVADSLLALAAKLVEDAAMAAAV